KNCVSVGGHLASIHSSAENTFIQELVRNTTKSDSVAWLGATDAAEKSVWVWTDGSAFDFINWSNGEPSRQSLENCIMMNNQAQYNDALCSAQLLPVCAKYVMVIRLTVISDDAFVTSTTSQLFLQKKHNLTFLFELLQNCVSLKGHLASVHSLKEYGFIRELVLNTTKSNAYTWLGGTDAAREGVWVYKDGSAFNYINWSSGQPDNYGNMEDCLMMNFPEYVTVIQLKLVSEKDLMASDSSQLFLQQVGVWVWTDGSAFNYNIWNSGEPNGGTSENCLLMNYPVYWNDYVCNNSFPSVCAKTAIIPEYVTVIRLKVISDKDLMASDRSQLFFQQLKGKLINRGLPSSFTVRLRLIKKNSP
ncbi:hypothetical protein NFI96_013869, partial [Prochilodus magdalenae]